MNVNNIFAQFHLDLFVGIFFGVQYSFISEHYHGIVGIIMDQVLSLAVLNSTMVVVVAFDRSMNRAPVISIVLTYILLLTIAIRLKIDYSQNYF